MNMYINIKLLYTLNDKLKSLYRNRRFYVIPSKVVDIRVDSFLCNLGD